MSDSDDVNQAAYRRQEVVDGYTERSTLQEGEAAIFATFANLSSRRMLDIGVGGGRTTGYFGRRVASYVGIDYSPELVEATCKRYPWADVSHGDARDLSRFADGSFDLVFFSFNGIDYVPDAGRRRVLAEVRRVLDTRGEFVFSSHNRDYERLGLMPWQGRRLGRSMLRQSARALRYARRRRQMSRGELVGPDHAIVNDDAHDWSLLTYYISPGAQVTQLRDAGFREVETFDQWGFPSDADEASVWRHYVARGRLEASSTDV